MHDLTSRRKYAYALNGTITIVTCFLMKETAVRITDKITHNCLILLFHAFVQLGQWNALTVRPHRPTRRNAKRMASYNSAPWDTIPASLKLNTKAGWPVYRWFFSDLCPRKYAPQQHWGMGALDVTYKMPLCCYSAFSITSSSPSHFTIIIAG